MRKSDAVSFFGSQREMAAGLGLAPSTVCEMPDPLPLGWALIVEKGSNRKRRVDYSLYDHIPPILQTVAERAR
jgi:hypothetical protein